MNFKTHELSFNLKDKKQFSAEEVKKALKAQNFPEAEVKSAPAAAP
jgi:hypothetical protein